MMNKTKPMKGVRYLTDQSGNATVLLIDLKKHDEKINDILEDILDVIACEEKKDEISVPFDQAMLELLNQGVISQQTYLQVKE